MAANYNNAAWFYDRLSKLVYGSALVRAQVYLLPFIPAGSNVLIAGGGTGWILEEIARIQPSGLTITYIEIAPKMMELSQKRNGGRNKIEFINDAVENVALKNAYDVVITPFLFDNFMEGSFRKLFAHLHRALRQDGVWLNTDFRPAGKWWQNILLGSMFLFFRLICRIEAKKLPDIGGCFDRNGYRVVDYAAFFGNFIVSTIYKSQAAPGYDS
jgi:ubiquinone/menaquinone biosynthesis C-methylase UbiE